MVHLIAVCDVCGHSQQQGVPLPLGPVDEPPREVVLAQLRLSGKAGSLVAEAHLCRPGCIEKEREALRQSVFGVGLVLETSDPFQTHAQLPKAAKERS